MKIPAAALASLLLAMSHVSMAKEEVVAPTDDAPVDLTPTAVQVVGKHDTRFKIFPCGKKDRKSADTSTGTVHGLRHLSGGSDGPKSGGGKPEDSDKGSHDHHNDDDVIKDGCKSDDRFMLVSIDHVREIGADGKVVPNRRVENLRDRTLTTTIDGNKIQWKLGMDKNLLQDKKGICRDVTADSALYIIAEITESATSVQNGVGTFKVAKDSLKWSFHAVDWPFCNGSTSLDITTNIRSRASKYARRESKDREEIHDGKHGKGKEGKDGDDHEAHPHKPQDKEEASTQAEVMLDESAVVTAPLSAVVNKGKKDEANVAVNMRSNIKSGPEWTSVENTYSLPSGVAMANGTFSFSDDIYFDPAISFNSATGISPSMSPAVIGGIAAGAGVAGIALVAGIIYARKSHVSQRV